jgi:opacity protein-like surface antigen
MFKTILATATAALIASAAAAPAHADTPYWGKLPNGVSANGINLQGVEMNGKKTNGTVWNGKLLNGKKTNGIAPAASSFVLEAIELPPQEH